MSQVVNKKSFLSKSPKSTLIAACVLLLFVVGGGAAFFLASNNTDLRNQASGVNDPYSGACSTNAQCAAGYRCAEAPGGLGRCVPVASSPSPTSTPISSVPTCGSNMGLFQGAVTNSSLCVLDGAEWYQCNAGYVNSNNGCVRTNATPSPILSPSVTPTPSPSSTLTYRLLGSPPFGQFCMPCTSGTECGYTLESCQARISAERGKQYCYTPPGCNLGILKDRCGVGEYTSPESCRLTSSAIAALPSPTPTPVPAQTYRIVGSPPFGQSCQLCANPAECGYSLASCESTIASMRGRVYCYTPPSCNIGILKDGCGSGETSDEGICRSMAQQSGVTTTGSTATGTGSLNGVTLVGD